MEKVNIHDHGFVTLVDKMGSDESIENAARISYGDGTREKTETKGLIRYLMRHRHTSPFEMCEVVFHLKLPIFVMRQLVRHRTASLNEYSGRYSEMSSDFYVPSREYLRKQSETNKQGRSDETLGNVGLLQYEYNRAHDGSHIAYQNLLREDVSREIARAVLPVSNYTEVIWKCDLHNFFHMVSLRSDAHAQQEIRDYSDAMYEIVKPLFPISCQAFEDYVLNGVTFSQEEMRIIRDKLDGSWTMSDYNLTKRERTEFLEKIKNER
jgi:thymidylate synthase (FAD)